MDEQPADSFDVEMPDIPMPEDTPQRATVDDIFTGGFKFAFIGSGQGGSRLTETFSKLGYRRVCAINTATQDLNTIDLPDSAKLCIGSGGAGKDPRVAASQFREHQEDVLDHMRRNFGTTVDRIFVCIGGGGGTGTGTLPQLVDAAHQAQEALKVNPNKVGLLLTLPRYSESPRVLANAYSVLQYATKLASDGIISPLVILDNEKIHELYPSLTVDKFWPTANTSVVTLFHLFNTLVARDSHYSTFDRSDFQTILDSGVIVFGATPVKKWDGETDISRAVRDNLKRNILAGGVSLAEGTVATSVIVGSQDVLQTLPQTHLDYAFDQLAKMLAPGATVHRGIYRGNKPGLAVYTAIGGFRSPSAKLAELRRLGQVVQDSDPWT